MVTNIFNYNNKLYLLMSVMINKNDSYEFYFHLIDDILKEIEEKLSVPYSKEYCEIISLKKVINKSLYHL